MCVKGNNFDDRFMYQYSSKFKVYVRDPKTKNIKKVNFGDPNMRIKKSNPARRRSFRARHNCD